VRSRVASILLVLSISSVALAQDVTAAEWVSRAEAAEADVDPEEARDAWQHVIDVAPTSRLASRARTRIAWIEARSEGDYAPLATLMAFLDRAPAERDAAVIGTFTDQVDAMPAGTVRAEARLAIAGEWMRLGETERALAAWQAALDDPDLPAGDRDLVHESMARTRMNAGDLQGTLDELDDADLGTVSLHHAAERRLRAETWVPIAYGTLAAFVLAVIALVARSGRRAEALRAMRDAPLRLVVAGLLALGPYAIVRWWGDDSIDAFLAFAPCSFVIVVLSYAAGEATETRALRLGVGAFAIVAALASAYASVALYGEALPFA